MFEHADDLLAGGRGADTFVLAGEAAAEAGAGAPLVAEDADRLGEVQRGEAGVDRIGEDRVAEGDRLVRQAGFLAAEEDAGPAGMGREGGDGLRRVEHRLFDTARAGGRGDGEGEARHGGFQRIEHAGGDALLQRAGGHGFGGGVRPAVARGDQAQVGEAEVQHDARSSADVFTQLGRVQEDGGRVQVCHVLSGFDGRARSAIARATPLQRKDSKTCRRSRSKTRLWRWTGTK